MSTTSLTPYKKPSNRRRNSGELDVFEAAQYFSGYNDNFTLVGGASMTPNIVLKEENKTNYLRVGRRISLDMPIQRHHHHYYHHSHQENHPVSQSNHHHHHHHHDRQQIKEKKCKQQPNSPGGKLANFLNSLFNQTSSRKKKSSKSTTTTAHSLKDEDESYNGRRKRRSSISHFWSSNNSLIDAKSIYSSSSSGFRTPPPNNLSTPTKSCKEFRSFAEHKDFLATLSKLSNNTGNGTNAKKDDKMRSAGSKLNSVDEKIKSKSGFFEKPMNKYKLFNNGYQEKNREINEYSEELMDDGVDSDSSSDLFELEIHDHGYRFCSTGLSVYETTRMDTINISSGTPITIKN